MTLTEIVTVVRYLIQDISSATDDIFTYENSSIFTLTEANVIAVTELYINDVEITSGFSYDTSTNQVTVSASLTTGDIVKISYTCYQGYSDTELDSFIRYALVLLSVYKYGTFTEDTTEDLYPEPTEEEKNLIALIASILIHPDNKSYALPDVRITVPNSEIPTMDRIRKILAMAKHDVHGLFLTE
jgi:hypothetical protein